MLDRDGVFFKKANIQDVSSWLSRIQYGIQEIEAMEKRTSTDIRTWIQNGDELIAASVRNCKKRHNTDRRVTPRTRTGNQQQMSHFFSSRTHRNNVKRWLTGRVKNTLPVKNIFTNVLEFMGLSPNLQNTYGVCDLLYPLLESTLVN